VCIHTAGANSLEFAEILPLLADRGFRAVALDLPGRGRSYPRDWEVNRSIHAHAESVYAFVRELGLEQPIIMGCSIGGDVTLDYVANHHRETRAAIALEGAARTPTFPLPTEFMQPANCPGWQDLMERVSGASLNRNCPPEKVEELRWIHRNAQVAAVGDLEGWATHDVRGQLGDVSCPVLVVKGADDFWLPAELVEETGRELPNGEVCILDGIGHYPMFEDPHGIADLVVDFLDRHGVGARDTVRA
jgi:pimeloyl-ACP methyl ester carboxylesterase